MGCSECENKPNRTADFTKNVVEIDNPDQLVLFRKVVVPASMGTPEDTPPAIGKYKNVLFYYESTQDAYLYSSDGIPTRITGDLSSILSRLDTLEEYAVDETAAREDADNNLQDQIEAIRAASDVVDIVGTYAELAAYDTSHLNQNDIIRVLSDETHDGATTYYRWTNNEWVFVGQLGPFYTQEELDQMFQNEATARETADNGLSSQIESASASIAFEISARESADNTLQTAIDAEASARGTADNGLHEEIVAEANARSKADERIEQAWQEEATARGTADQALRDALDAEISDRQSADTNNTQAINAEVANRMAADNVLQNNIDSLSTAIDGKQNNLTAGTGIDITDDVISVAESGPAVVQTTGTSIADVMSQNATSSMVFSDPASGSRVRIGAGAQTDVSNAQNYPVAIGANSSAHGMMGVAIGSGSIANGAPGRVALGAYSGAQTTGTAGVVEIGTSNTAYGYNETNYRMLTGLHDPESAHDAATKGYVDTGLSNAGTAFTNAEFNSIFGTTLTEEA